MLSIAFLAALVAIVYFDVLSGTWEIVAIVALALAALGGGRDAEVAGYTWGGTFGGGNDYSGDSDGDC